MLSLLLRRGTRPNATILRTFQRRALLAGAGLATLTFLAVRPAARLESDVAAEDVKIDPATGIEFPTTARIPSKLMLPTFTLVGLGVRKVSFLRIKVYSVAFYADLSNPNLAIPPNATFDEKLEHILENSACFLRIVPTRTTSYTHLRDGFVKAVQARMRICRERGTLPVDGKEWIRVVESVSTLKSIFPNEPLQKHGFLDIILPPPVAGQERVIIFRDIGRVKGDWMAKQFFLGYFEGWGISPPLKETAQACLADFGVEAV